MAAFRLTTLVLGLACLNVNAQTGEWTWMGGSSAPPCQGLACGASGVYGTLGTPAAGNVPGGRFIASSWTDTSGNFWLFGGSGYDSTGAFGSLNDLWKFDATTREWAWMGGSSTIPGIGSGQPGVYGTLGTPAAGNVPGGRGSATSWTDSSGNFWLFGGNGYDSTGLLGSLNDLWEFNIATREWTWMGGSNKVPSAVGLPGVYGTLGTPAAGNFPGSRVSAAGWADSSGSLWLFGGLGPDSAGTAGSLNDLWRFIVSTHEWAWMGGSSTVPAIESGQPGVYGTLSVPAAGNVPGGRDEASSWTDKGGHLWLFGGAGFDSKDVLGDLNDLWEFNTSTLEWAWIGGSKVIGSCAVATCGQLGVYGTLGVPAPGNGPGGRNGAASWADSSGNFWIFGGLGTDSAGNQGWLNDLWEFNPSTAEWTWRSGSSTMVAEPGGVYGISGVYGTLDVAAPQDVPGGRRWPNSWIDSSGAFWLFGGDGFDSTGAQGSLNDLWVYQPGATTLPPAATPTFSVPPGTYTSPQTVTISDTTPGATIYYTTNGTTPSISSTPYTGPITVSSTETVEAIAIATGYAASGVTAAAYIISVAPAANVSPATLTFAALMVNSTSSAQPVALSNPGNTALTITSITASTNFAQTNNCGSSLAANGSCSISVTFTPSAGGLLTGTLTVTDNSNNVAGNTQTVSLSGTGQDFSFSTPTGSSTSATVAPGAPASYTLSVGSMGGLTGTVSFTCTGAPSEATCTVSPNPANPGTNVAVNVTTKAPSRLAPRGSPPTLRLPRPQPLLRFALVLVCIIGALAIWRSQEGIRRGLLLLPLAGSLVLVVTLAGCGGGGGGGGGTQPDPGTPAGTYTLTVTGTVGSGPSAVSHSVGLTLKVD